jgi:pimeloyl-ACP methyl ester carboxylesterase
MKTIWILTIILGLGLCGLGASGISGDWNGILDVQVMQLKLVFHITEGPEGLSATMDSPDQKAFGIEVSSISFNDPVLTMDVSASHINYTGELKDGMITGTFRQAGQEYPLDLVRGEVEKKALVRPQEPIRPFPYYEEDVVFQNAGAGIKLAGTLTLPDKEGVYPVVVLITGSGGQDRDEALMGHKPFLVISDHLTRKGIGVLRFDDRGIGASEGDVMLGDTYDLAGDVRSAVDYLKTRPEVGMIGLAGHSEGGIIAPIVAAQTGDVGFIILLAGTGIRGDKLLLLQEELIMRASGAPEEEIAKTLDVNKVAFDMVINAESLDSLKVQLGKYLNDSMDSGLIEIPENMTRDEMYSLQLDSVANPWMYEFIRLDPSVWLEKVKCPVLALNGSKDLQVPPKENLAAIGAALDKAGNKDYTLKEFPGLNHLFQECETGSPTEYATIEQTFSPVVLETMTDWIKTRTQPR